MGLGTFEYFSDLFGGSKLNNTKRSLQTVELKVRMDCDGCEHKVQKAASSIKGVQTVDIDRKLQKVTVTGYVDPKKVIKKVKGTGKKTEIWPYMHYNAVTNPIVSSQTYDKKAPPGYVRKGSFSFGRNSNKPDDQYTTMFSEENPNSCTVM